MNVSSSSHQVRFLLISVMKLQRLGKGQTCWLLTNLLDDINCCEPEKNKGFSPFP